MINQTRREYAVFLLLAGVCIVSIRFHSRNCSWFETNAGTPEELDDYTIPTLLSVVNDETGRYQYALENPMYDKLMSGTFLPSNYEVDVADPPILHLNEVDIRIRDPLHLSWTLGQTSSGEDVVEDSDIIVLYCDKNDKKNLLDAATIAQAKATSKKHTLEASGFSDTLKDTVWYFPSFPVIRYEVCQFSLLKPLPKNSFVLLASSQQLNIRDGNTAPTAIHLALGDSIDEMVVQFKTGMQGGTPVVKYGPDEDSLLRRATGTTRTYSAKDMCESPATTEEPGKFQPPGQLHTVRLTHLAPNQTYYYSVGVEYPGVPTRWSELFSFVSAPETKPEPGSFSYIVYGDQGCPSVGWGLGGAWTAAMASRETKGTENSLPIRAVHHFGDLSYARGAAHIWDEWLNMISSFTTRVPLMVAVGNHEYDHTSGGDEGRDPSGVPTPGGYKPRWGNFQNDSGGECGVPTANHFTMPNSTNSNGVFWYSFDFGNVHTTVVSSEHDLSPGSIQYEWLENDLKSVDRAAVPWLVFELHRPMYEAGSDPLNRLVGEEVRHRIEGLLKEYEVDLVLAGHYHSYQRSCAGLYKSKCNNGGPVHITIGSAGAKLGKGHLMPGSKWTEKVIKGVYGYGRITVVNASAMHFELIQAGGCNDTDAGKVLDETWIVKDTKVVSWANEVITTGDQQDH